MKLRPYQEVGRDFLAARPRALLADGMRVGKTPQALLAAVKVGARRVLVACPAIAVPQWKREAAAWAPELQLTAVSHTRAVLDRDALGAVGPWDVLIPDEAHFLQNPEAQRTKAIYGRGGLGWSAGAIWPLSGTPVTKSAAGLWPMMFAFGMTKLGYNSWVNWACVKNALGHVIGTRASVAPELRAMLARVMLRRTLADVAPELPPIQYNTLAVEGKWPEGEAARVVAAQAAHVRAALQELPPAERAGALALLANSSAELRRFTALAKVPWLADYIGEGFREGLTSTVVFAWHTAAIDSLAHELKARFALKVATLDGRTPAARREEIQEAFREGRLQVVVAQIAAAGTAIDLSTARHGYILEQDWIPAANVQAAHRLLNMTRSDPVSFDIATWCGSVDEDVQTVLARRAQELRAIY